MVQSLFNFITEHIFFIIYLFAAVEMALVTVVIIMMKRHERTLLDIADNLLKGFNDAPDRDSSQTLGERIRSALDFMSYKVLSDEKFKNDFIKNARRIGQRPLYNRHFKIEMVASVMATLVQVFPLLGILGTILAIARTAFQNGGQVDVSSLSNAFVLAMDTTILGISFSIVFMVIESTLSPRIERVINESFDYKRIVSQINLNVSEKS